MNLALSNACKHDLNKVSMCTPSGVRVWFAKAGGRNSMEPAPLRKPAIATQFKDGIVPIGRDCMSCEAEQGRLHAW
jgi:hypothetical protein